MSLWHAAGELFGLARRELFTAVVGDVIDSVDLRRQFPQPEISPLRDDMVVIGRAKLVLEANVFGTSLSHSSERSLSPPFFTLLGGQKHLCSPSLALKTTPKCALGKGLSPPARAWRALDDLRRHEVYICTGGSPH